MNHSNKSPSIPLFQRGKRSLAQAVIFGLGLGAHFEYTGCAPDTDESQCGSALHRMMRERSVILAAIALPLASTFSAASVNAEPENAAEREPPVPSAKNTWSVSPWM